MNIVIDPLSAFYINVALMLIIVLLIAYPTLLQRALSPKKARLCSCECDKCRYKQREADFAIVDEIRAGFSDVSASEIKTEVTKALREIRKQRREDFDFLANMQKTFDDVPVEEHERETARVVKAAKERLRAKRR